MHMRQSFFDKGDGWGREEDDEGYYREYSENRAYPLGVNNDQGS